MTWLLHAYMQSAVYACFVCVFSSISWCSSSHCIDCIAGCKKAHVENGMLVSMSHKIPSLRHGIIVALFRFPSQRPRPWEFFLPCSLQRHVWCPALLSTLERTNQLLYSEQFNRNGPWCPKNHNQRWVPLFVISTCHPNRSHESPLAFIY
jgi:hypothetical protein